MTSVTTAVGGNSGWTAAAERVLARITPGRLIFVGVTVTIVALALGLKSGTTLGPNTRGQVLLVVAGCSLVALSLVVTPRPLVWPGMSSLVAFATLTALTALSILWSLSPDRSWEETNRMLAYLAVFAGAMALARIAPRRWDAILSAIAAATVLLSLCALTPKILPGILAPDETFARLRLPFEYWNAVGLMAASGVPALLWLAARRSGHAVANALAYPGLGIVILCLFQAYSRGSLLALGFGLALWFAAVPLRLRAAVALIVAAVPAGLVVLWSFKQPGLTTDALPLSTRGPAGLQLGLMVGLMVAVLTAIGLAIGYVTAQHPPSARARRVASRTILGALGAAVAAAAIAFATAPGGPTGQVSSMYKSLTTVGSEGPDNGPGRLTSLSGVRALYWSEAFRVHAMSPWVGAGAGAYTEVRKRFRATPLYVRDAHGYVTQTLADLGWIGLVVSVGAMLAWLVAAVRVCGLRPRDRGLPWDAERVAVMTLVVIVVLFGLHSAIDWTWVVPGTAVLALICAGWVAGRRPLRERIAGEGPTGMVAAAERVGMVPSRGRFGLREVFASWRPAPLPAVVALAVLAIGAATAWAVVQPLRSANASDAAFARAQSGDIANAIAISEIAIRRNPLAVTPRFELASFLARTGDLDRADRVLREAVALQPANAEAWRRLGRLRLARPETARAALKPFQAAYFLDPRNSDSESDLVRIGRYIQATPPTPTAQPQPQPTQEPIP